MDALTLELKTLEYLTERSVTEFYGYLGTLRPEQVNRLVFVLTTAYIDAAGTNKMETLPSQMLRLQVH
jgi:hypothetical protein